MTQETTLRLRPFGIDVHKFIPRIITNIYSNQEIFLRELISNSNDALDKVRYNSSINIDDVEELCVCVCIYIILNKKNRTLAVMDNGIGMTETEIINNLGTIAKSGTKIFKSTMDCDSMIGKFGIGFYSVYLVADKIVVTSKRYGDDLYEWESNSHQRYSIRCDRTNNSMVRGTKVVLYIKDSQSKYLEGSNIKEIVEKYFQFNKYAIKLLVEKDCENQQLDKNEAEKQEKTKRTIKKAYKINRAKPVFLTSVLSNCITPESFKKIMKLNSDQNRSIYTIYFSVKKSLEFNAILYIPNVNRMSFNQMKKKNEIKLYVRHVFIMDCEKLMPNYLSFIKGIIHSKNLPLNISREKVNSSILNIIRNSIVENCVKFFEDVSRDQRYEEFYKQFGRNIKRGICEDSPNRDKLARLLRYRTSASGDEACSLQDYINRMKKNQRYIYFIAGESMKQVEDSVFIEALKMRDIEVIYMTDPIDEFMVERMRSFDGKPLMSVAEGELVLPEDKAQKKTRMLKVNNLWALCRAMENVLSDKVEISVVVSNRLVKSPCCVVSLKHDKTANMERIVKTQKLYKMPMERKFCTKLLWRLTAKKQFEINPDHVIVQNLATRVTISGDLDASIKNVIILLFETALISSDFIPEKPELHINSYIYQLIKNELLASRKRRLET
ncbi:LOW QUALITY PROTEIN: heat shock protein 83 [Temnothorax nylanderi]|uniref:LOW QUALITY PROTEIN: heat shock protein 83 n=1 Tax=Temnothorax nylanderi TaxID=102681 RepID=UPI003A8C3447